MLCASKILADRLGKYKYYDMDAVIASLYWNVLKKNIQNSVYKEK